MNTSIQLDKNFFTGGRSTFTIDNGKGTHYTFKIKKPKWDERARCVFLLTGPDNENSYTYLGMFCQFTGNVKLTSKSKMNDESLPVKVIRWAMKHVFTDKVLPEGYAIRHMGKCGCCGRALTVPESLIRGIGPECWAKLGGA